MKFRVGVVDLDRTPAIIISVMAGNSTTRTSGLKRERFRKIIFWLSIGVVLTSASLLVSGSGLLVRPVTESSTVPLGTFITWAGLIALPKAILFGRKELYYPSSQRDALYRLAMISALVWAFAWGFVGYALAGNWAMTFSGYVNELRGGELASKLYWANCYFTAMTPLLILALILTER